MSLTAFFINIYCASFSATIFFYWLESVKRELLLVVTFSSSYLDSLMANSWVSGLNTFLEKKSELRLTLPVIMPSFVDVPPVGVGGIPFYILSILLSKSAFYSFISLYSFLFSSMASKNFDLCFSASSSFSLRLNYKVLMLIFISPSCIFSLNLLSDISFSSSYLENYVFLRSFSI